MANLTFDIRSRALGKETQFNVVLPENCEKPETGWKTLYLLHGWSDNYTTWMNQTSIERYALKRNIAVIMPDGEFGFWNDMADGIKYFTFVTEDLPQICSKYFGCSTRREDVAIAGLSMGGLGSLSIGLSRPDLYMGIICLSAANWPNNMFHEQYVMSLVFKIIPALRRQKNLNVFPVRESAAIDFTRFWQGQPVRV